MENITSENQRICKIYLNRSTTFTHECIFHFHIKVYANVYLVTGTTRNGEKIDGMTGNDGETKKT